MTDDGIDPAALEHREAAGVLLAASQGDEPDLGRLVAHYLPHVREFVRLRIGPGLRQRESDSDIVQSVCRELVEDWDRLDYRGEAAFRGWLFTAALNKIREKGRFHGRERRDGGRETAAGAEFEVALSPSPSQFAMGGETREQLERIMDEMPDDYREVITLCRIARLPNSVVAEQMGRSVGAVRQLLGRALLQLSEKMKRVGGAGG